MTKDVYFSSLSIMNLPLSSTYSKLAIYSQKYPMNDIMHLLIMLTLKYSYRCLQEMRLRPQPGRG